MSVASSGSSAPCVSSPNKYAAHKGDKYVDAPPPDKTVLRLSICAVAMRNTPPPLPGCRVLVDTELQPSSTLIPMAQVKMAIGSILRPGKASVHSAAR